MTRNAVIQIRIDPATRDRLRRLRQERHVNVSAWIRQLVQDALDRELPASTHPAAPWTATVTEVLRRSPERVLVRHSGRPRAGKATREETGEEVPGK